MQRRRRAGDAEHTELMVHTSGTFLCVHNNCRLFSQPSSDKSKLFCWYETEVHPAFKIGPHKVELLSRLPRPEIVMFHDLISKKALAHLKNEAKNAVFYAYRDTSGKPKTGTKLHMSSIASLPAFWATKHVDRTIDRLTGLTSNRNRQDSGLQLNLFAPAGNHHIFPQSVAAILSRIFFVEFIFSSKLVFLFREELP